MRRGGPRKSFSLPAGIQGIIFSRVSYHLCKTGVLECMMYDVCTSLLTSVSGRPRPATAEENYGTFDTRPPCLLKGFWRR